MHTYSCISCCCSIACSIYTHNAYIRGADYIYTQCTTPQLVYSTHAHGRMRRMHAYMHTYIYAHGRMRRMHALCRCEPCSIARCRSTAVLCEQTCLLTYLLTYLLTRCRSTAVLCEQTDLATKAMCMCSRTCVHVCMCACVHVCMHVRPWHACMHVGHVYVQSHRHPHWAEVSKYK